MPALGGGSWPPSSGQDEPLKNELRSIPAYARARHLDYVLVTSSDLARENLERFRPLLTEVMSSARGFVRVYHSSVADIYMDEWAIHGSGQKNALYTENTNSFPCSRRR